ncbi:hypothetical protein RhiirA5_410354 [Rhizophagus irregularis]|uniref:Uncharacterized protein n=1 Tax=Rhizophagus irregularis TaxID=588596 RepID=A0A2I1DWY5_9GLOM|nr:hypothetical protein RhiirA5_410354 [Rhizophagus irregularis]PKC74218.1 hypothetical protein RhiirA1_450263 [Rhizophagus irregularis]PKY14387.1 hypothetical protein RhiirB3_426370 [Rhizophagus irregularis]
MSHLVKYTNIIDLKKITECVINRKSLLETFSIIFQNMKLTCSTTINNYVKCILSAEEYNNTEKYIKNHKTKTFQKQVAQLESTESTNDMPVYNYVKPMDLKILENAEYQSMVVELSNLNNEN